MAQTLVEKIAQKFAVGLSADQEVHAGDYIMIQPAYVMTHDNTGAVIPKFKSIGATKLFNPRQVVHTLDHDIQNKSEKNLEKYKKIEEFSISMGADFYPAGRGIGHQIMCEEGYAFPGTMVVASDSHSNMYGGLGCLGTPIVRTDAAAIWATGKTWWKVPPIAKVELTGKLRKGVTGKDVIISLCGYFNNDEVLNHAIEFVGEGVTYLSIEERLTIANMTTEWGALVGLFPIDEKTIEWLGERDRFIRKRGLEGVPSDKNGNGKHPRINEAEISQLVTNIFKADDDAFFPKELKIDLSSIEPYIAGPNSVKVMNSVSELKKKELKINKAYLVSCVNSRLNDIKEAAEIVNGKKIADGVEFYVAAASSEVQKESELAGYWQVLIDAGAIPLPPGCGPCIGLGTGLLEDGEVGISATNRNFKGRMGSPNAQAYLASPAVVASSAIEGIINFDWENGNKKIIAEIKANKKTSAKESSVKILPGFPSVIEGNLLFCDQDNLNTDGIYPGKYTYMDDFTSDRSSREQAATALLYKGTKCVVAGSFSETYARNAINNGFLVIQCADLINDLKEKYGNEKLTVQTNLKVKIDFENSSITFDGKEYSIDPVGEAAQELIIDGGLENWVKKNL
jgi:homoaconitate hydratase